MPDSIFEDPRLLWQLFRRCFPQGLHVGCGKFHETNWRYKKPLSRKRILLFTSGVAGVGSGAAASGVIPLRTPV